LICHSSELRITGGRRVDFILNEWKSGWFLILEISYFVLFLSKLTSKPMIQAKDTVTLPKTLEEFKAWEPEDGLNGGARAVRMK